MHTHLKHTHSHISSSISLTTKRSGLLRTPSGDVLSSDAERIGVVGIDPVLWTALLLSSATLDCTLFAGTQPMVARTVHQQHFSEATRTVKGPNTTCRDSSARFSNTKALNRRHRLLAQLVRRRCCVRPTPQSRWMFVTHHRFPWKLT